MNNLLALYNPYYQKDVMEQHVDVLLNYDSQTFATVAFGKIRSQLRDYEHPYEEKLQKIYSSATEEEYVQLFLTDYSSIYVAKVVEVLSDDCLDMAPSYYKEKNLDVENWFIISDIRRIVHNDFEHVRDKILANFTTPNFADHHYAIYGNKYVYPLVVDMDEPIDYFQTDNEDFRYFTEIYKSEKSLAVKKALMDYRFGEANFYAFHPNTQDAIVSAEIEFEENKNDPLYDFTGVVMKLSKAFEKEIFLFMRALFEKLILVDSAVGRVEYSVMNKNYRLTDYRNHKPNLGTNPYLIKKYEVKQSINDNISNSVLRQFIFTSIPEAIYAIQSIRNETAHSTAASLKECLMLRNRIIGIGNNGILCDLIVNKGKL